MVKYLVENGADDKAKDGSNRTPLMLASYFGHLEIVKYLLDKNATRLTV